MQARAKVLGTAALLCLPVLAQEAADPVPASLQQQAQIRNWVFGAVDVGKSTVRPGVAGGLEGQPESMAGREDIAPGRWRAECTSAIADPLALIAEQARKTNIVIINESHASPRHRQFVGQMLETLRAQGYDTYAAETFGPGELNHAGVLGTDGWYSNEPIFARTVLRAKQLGYRLLAYEWPGAGSGAIVPGESETSRRERMQTENLMTRIFTPRPEAKVVVHVGGGHVNERRSSGTGVPMMAERLKAATGRDPLTIAQGSCATAGEGGLITHDAAANDDPATRDVDLVVWHPKLDFRDGRPAWRQAAGDKPVQVPTALLERGERMIIEARPAGESLAVVPTDRLLLLPGERLPMLLPPGRYRIDGFVPAGRIEIDPVLVEVH